MKSVSHPLWRQRLLSGAAVAALLGLQVVQAAPALAANECGALDPANGAVTCAPGAYAGGITYGSLPVPPASTTNVDVKAPSSGSVGGTGITISTSSGGTAQADFTGNLAITTNAAGANGVTLNSSGAAVVTGDAGGAETITTNGADSAGFSLSSTAAAIRTATFNFLGTIITRGDNSPGVAAHNVDTFGTTGAPNSVGTIKTYGANSNGVDVTLGAAGAAAPSVVLDASNAIETFGANSNAINISSAATADTVIDVTSSGGITTEGSGSGGIAVGINNGTIGVHAGQVSTAGANADAIDLNILGSGSITVDGLTSITTKDMASRGVVATTNQGNVSINASGANIQTGASGLVAKSTTGNAVVDATGVTIDTQADAAVGASAQSGTGDATVTLTGTITTKGKAAHGASATAADGNATVDVNASVTTNGDNAAGAIASVTGTGTASALSGVGTINTSGATAHGLAAVNSGSGNASAGATNTIISTQGDGANGVLASTIDGTALATAQDATITTSGKDAVGVLAKATSGDATANVDPTTITTSGDGAHAIQATTANGAATATSSGDTLTTSGKSAYGISALNTGMGAALASETGSTVTTNGDQSHGLQAKTAGGDATVDTTSGTIKTSGAGANGIDVQATSGNARGTAGANTITTSGDGSAGMSVIATGGGAVGVTKIGSGAAISTSGVGADGIHVSAAGGDAIASVVAGTSVKTSGAKSAAVNVSSADGNATAMNVAGSTVQTSGAGSDGFLVRALKNALATVGELITVNGTGSKGVDVGSTGATAADNATADVAASVKANGANATAVSASTNAGTAAVNVKADVFAIGTNGIAIEAVSTAGFGAVDLRGNVTAGGTGVHLGAAGGNTLTNNAGFALNGGTVAAIHVDKGAATIVNDGTMAASGNRLVLANGAAGAVALTNNGLMSGFMTLSANNNSVMNSAGAVWTAKATSDFGTGNNTVTNAGTLRTDPTQAGTAQVVFNRLTTLANKATGLITMINGKEGDSISTSGNYSADAGARLGVDAHLGGPGSRADTFAVGGSATGTTNIVVNDTNAGPGRYNPDGITVVTVGGANAVDSFKLANGPIDKGLWQYDLARFGSGTFKLVTAPSGEVMAAPSLLSQTNRYWQVGQNAFDDHRASIRAMISGSDPVVAAAPQQALGYTASESNPFDNVFASMNFGKTSFVSTGIGSGTALWGQVVHASFTDHLNNATSAGSATWSYDTRTQQDLTRFLGGIDFGAELRGNTALSFGLFGGYGTSDGTMNTSASGGLRGGLSSLALKGSSIGGYAQYMAGPWWFGGSTLYDSLDNTYRIDRVGFSSKMKGSIWGTQLDGGYTVDWRFGSIEPYVALTYLSTRYNDVDSPWGRFNFGNQDGLDGKLGARARVPVWAAEAWNATLLGNLAITHGFKDGGLVTFDGFAIPNAKVANWGDIGGGVEVGTRDSRLSGYVKGDWLAASGLNGYSVLGGLNYRW